PAEPLFGGLLSHARPARGACDAAAPATAGTATGEVGDVTDQLRQAMGRWTPGRVLRGNQDDRAASIAPSPVRSPHRAGPCPRRAGRGTNGSLRSRCGGPP